MADDLTPLAVCYDFPTSLADKLFTLHFTTKLLCTAGSVNFKTATAIN